MPLALAVQMLACGADEPDASDFTPPGEQTPPPQQTPDAGVAPLPTVDAGIATAPDSATMQCAAVAERCEAADECCPGTVCVVDVVEPTKGLCAASCKLDSACASGCCADLGSSGTGACAPASYCESRLPALPDAGLPPILPPVRPDAGPVVLPPVGGRITLPAGCGPLELVAHDGTYLGLATSLLSGDSVCNEVGRYGSEVSSTSIFNSVGQYGSAVSSKSAYSEVTSTPPALICAVSMARVAYVTRSIKIPAIDPDDLCDVLSNSGL